MHFPRAGLCSNRWRPRALVDVTDASYMLSEMRFHSGVDAYLTVLDSQRTFR
jgi:outer membrane protein TolC